MPRDARRYHLFSRSPRHSGAEIIAATGVPEGERAELARDFGVSTIFTEVIDIERTTADVRSAAGEAIDMPDAALAAYRLLLSLDQVPLKRRRFEGIGGEVQVQGEYFRSAQDSQVWREAPQHRLTPMQTPDLGQALGPLIGLRREQIRGATWVEVEGQAVVAIELARLEDLRQARIGAGAGQWVRAHGRGGDQAFSYALISPEGTSPLSDGHVRLVDYDGAPLGIDGSLAACGLVALWGRSPSQSALSAELGDGQTVTGRISVWVEGPVDAPERVSIAGHVREGDPV